MPTQVTEHPSTYDWDHYYPRGVNAWELYERLAKGEKPVLRVHGTEFELAFAGETLGANGWVEVRSENGETRRYGWGQRLEHIWQCLEELQSGWDKPRRYKYREFRTVE